MDHPQGFMDPRLGTLHYMVRNGLVQFHVKCFYISITFIIEKAGSSFSINSEIIIKEIWLMKAPRLKVSSFYFGLLTAIKCDTGHKNRESGLKVTCLHLVLTVQEAVQAGMSHPCSKATDHRKSRRERNHCCR